jgi:hypothetical protein
MEIAKKNRFGASANATHPSIPHPNREQALKRARLTAGFPNIVNGQRIDSSRRIKISDPVTGEELASVTDTQKDGLDQAVQAAKAAFPLWSSKTWNERRDLLANAMEDSDPLSRRSSIAGCRPVFPRHPPGQSACGSGLRNPGKLWTIAGRYQVPGPRRSRPAGQRDPIWPWSLRMGYRPRVTGSRCTPA